MGNTLTQSDLENLPEGSQVRDTDGDTWTKNGPDTWDAEGIGGYYSGWSSYKLHDYYGSDMVPVEAEPTEKQIESDAVAAAGLVIPEAEEITVAVVLDAREGFLERVDGLDAYEIFDILARADHLNSKFFLDYAESHNA